MTKRALIVEGGGMRGAHSAGALAALSEANPPHFDVVCGSSAGSCTLAFWVSEQYQIVERIWSDYLHDDRFIKFRRLVTPGPVMDLDYLVHDVFVKREPLDTGRILASPIDFFITTTNCHTGQAHYFHNKNPIDVLTALRAGAAMPLAYPLPVWCDGEPYADGGIADSIPVQRAIDHGCEEFWILLTQPAGYRKAPPGRLRWPRWIFRQYPALAQALRDRYHRYNRQLELVESLERNGRAKVIRPSTELPVGRLTRQRRHLLAAIAQGRRDAASLVATH